jgi:hypothetical protein
MRRKKVTWHPNDVFAIPLMDGNYAIGHVLDQRMINAVRIALYSEVIIDINTPNLSELVNDENLISLIEVTREQLDCGVWKIVGNKHTVIPIENYANEQFRNNKWINSVIRDAALAEDFLNSYYAFLAWDDWFDPNYLDNYLISLSKKPDNLLYKKNNQ